MSADRRVVVGGLGWPHDELAAATLARNGVSASPLGALDGDALERGQSLLPRGQCAPMLYLTGAIVRQAMEDPAEPLAFLTLQSCGPCRYALFAPEWRRVLDAMGRSDVWITRIGQGPTDLARRLTATRGLLEALTAADALTETARRIAPHSVDPDEVDRLARQVSDRIAARVASGVDPIRALAEERGWHESIRRAPSRPLARAVVVGEPWSLHVDGDGQLHLPQALARAGVEVEIPPASLWLAYLLWQADAQFGRELVDSETRATAHRLRRRLSDTFAAAADAAGLSFPLDDPAELAELASEHVNPSLRGGYGHIEIGLALRARRERRGHVLLSVRSFGCVPSAGITDAILPAALAGELPFLALDVSGDGEAARESRLSLRVSGALDLAYDEVRRACEQRGVDESFARTLAIDPLATRIGRRPYACSLANAVAEHD